MSHGIEGKRRRGASHWVVQTLEGRVLLSGAGQAQAAAPSAQVESIPGQHARPRRRVRHAVEAGRTAIVLTATVKTAGTNRLLSAGTVRFSVVSPTSEGLGSAHVDKLGQATLSTFRLGGTRKPEGSSKKRWVEGSRNPRDRSTSQT